MLTDDLRFKFSSIPPYRNYQCPAYGICLDKAVAEGSTGWNCLNCDHQADREPIDPTEGWRCLTLLAEIYGPGRVVQVVRDMVEPPQPDKEWGRWRQVLREQAA